MINVVCLKWGDKYGPEYVNRLYTGVLRHTTKEFKFWCFTENPQGLNSAITVVPLVHDLDTWWNKLYLFSDEIPIPTGEQIFYIDLDTLVVGNIDGLLTEDHHRIVVLRDFYHDLAKTSSLVGSGLMSWKSGYYTKIWQEFSKDPAAAIRLCRPHGDQKWVEHTAGDWHFWQDLWPNQVVSFKVHCREGLPADARIVCYHGKPSIPDSAVNHTDDWQWKLTPQSWVLDHWKD